MKKRIRRLAALIGAVFLIISLIATLIVAFSGNTALLFALLFIDIILPVFLYAYFTIYKVIKNDRENE